MRIFGIKTMGADPRKHSHTVIEFGSSRKKALEWKVRILLNYDEEIERAVADLYLVPSGWRKPSQTRKEVLRSFYAGSSATDDDLLAFEIRREGRVLREDELR